MGIKGTKNDENDSGHFAPDVRMAGIARSQIHALCVVKHPTN